MTAFTFLISAVLLPLSETALADEVTREDINAACMALPVSSNEIPGWPQGPETGSESAILMEADTGVILYSKNIDIQHYPASTTKVMTCLLAAENCSMDEMVGFSKNAVFGIDRGSSNVGMDVGQEITMEEALYCIMLASANEVAVAVAEHISGSVEEFSKLMNERAKELGCTNTNFVNPNGLPDEEHLTTAHDLALIAREFNKNETLRRISGTRIYDVNATSTQPDTFTMTNHHKMYPGNSQSYDFTTWGKTGYTNVARETLVTCAEKDSMNLICVVMKAEPPLQYTDTYNLFEYGFQNFERLNIAENETKYNLDSSDFFNSDNGIFGNTKTLVSLSTDGYVVIPKTASFEDLTSEVTYDDKNENSLAKITYTYGDIYVGETDVLLSDSNMKTYMFGENVEEDEEDTLSANGAPGFNNAGVVFLDIKQVLIIAGIAAGVVLIVLLIILFIKNYFFSAQRRRRKIRKRNRRYFSEFDDFDF
ncbi:MAG: D-alanyl-D-alanine carboxypeptidase [Lachnospiraceae bacterium]|nr:D-alanyl-D-alanine carboxypeptidase [Lachnospiraceae bacterium]